MKNLDVNTARWSIFCLSLFKLQFIFGEDYTENLRSTKNQPLKSLRQFFKWLGGWSRIRQKLLDWPRLTGSSLFWTTLLSDRAVQFATANTYAFPDSVLCLGGISDEPGKAWESRIKWFLETRCLKDLDRIDGESMEFEWKNFPGFATLWSL